MKKNSSNKYNKKNKMPELSPKTEEFLYNLPHNKMLALKQEKIAKIKNKFWDTVSLASIAYFAWGGLRTIDVVEKPSLYTNNEKVIMQNLDDIGLDDEIFIRSRLNNEILFSMQKHITVSVDNSLSEEYRKCLKDAVNYVNYIIHGINPEYTIKMATNSPFTTIKVHEFNKSTDFYNWLSNINGDYEKDEACMISSFTQGYLNNNGIYKSQIHVDKEYFDELLKEDKEYFYDFCTTTYIHELCHCIFGINDFSSNRFYSIMNDRNERTCKAMLYHDLMAATASICNLENPTEKIRAYGFVSHVLGEQIEQGVESESYRDFLVKRIAELEAEIAITQTDMEMN